MMVCVLLFLVLFLGSAADWKTGLVPNRLIFSGAALLCLFAPSDPAFAGHVSEIPFSGKYLFLTVGYLARYLGILLFLFPLARIRLFGAGDMKLAALLPAFMGVREGGGCVICALFFAALFSLGRLLRGGLFKKRMEYFLVRAAIMAEDLEAGRRISPYRERGRGEETFPFAPFLFLGFLLGTGVRLLR